MTVCLLPQPGADPKQILSVADSIWVIWDLYFQGVPACFINKEILWEAQEPICLSLLKFQHKFPAFSFSTWTKNFIEKNALSD